jgi:hypothetical protein
MGASAHGSRADDGPWAVLVSSTRGAAHEAVGTPNQDAWAWRRLPSVTGVVVALADGHGHPRHFRAERGSRLAVETACRCVDRLGPELTASDGVALERSAREMLVPALVAGWRHAVAEDLAGAPLTDLEEAVRAATDDDPVLAYGSTLLVAVLAEEFAVAVQIGDGDVVALAADGGARLAVPGDASLDGQYTTSLCQPAAAGSFRVGAIGSDAVAVLLATDGFANAQVAEPWVPAVGRDIVAMLESHGTAWIAGQLPAWTARCASSDGSGDDTTVALVVRRP